MSTLSTSFASLRLGAALVLSIAFCSLSGMAVAAENGGAEPAPQQRPAEVPTRQAGPQVSTTRHQLETPAGVLRYMAEAGELTVTVAVDGGEHQGRIFYVYYRAEEGREGGRPLSFVFNGGPGAASVWLHLGALGPKIIAMNPDGTLPPPPVELRTNELSWLRFTDLVFIDPIGTGYSRGLQNDGRPFWGVNEDLRSVGEFIRLFLTMKQRWLNPLFLVGESYGTVRAAALSDFLLQRYGVWLNGLVLVSPILDFATVAYGSSLNLPFALALPSYAATSAHFGRIDAQGGTLGGDLLARVEAFALSEYLTGLNLGSSLQAHERRELFERVSSYSGLPVEVVEQVNGRISVRTFAREFLREEGLVLGRMDATIRGIDHAPEDPLAYEDPSLVPLFGPFSSGAHAYIAGELKYESELFYEFLNQRVGAAWEWSGGIRGWRAGQGYVDVSADLKTALSRNPSLRVLLACGYFDLATPYFAILHTIRQMELDERIRGNVVFRTYHAGHMMYLHENARTALYGDAAEFYSRSLDR
jgi:carboxypeptidase C (cathepsin A)